MILNLKGLNKHIEYHFKMDTLWSAVRLMTLKCFIASLDLKMHIVGFSIPWNDDTKYDTVYSFILQQTSTSKYPKYI